MQNSVPRNARNQYISERRRRGDAVDQVPEQPRRTGRLPWAGAALLLLLCCPLSAVALTSVLTERYDIARTNQNPTETTLTPANVNPNQFGKLFSSPVDGYVYAQPLYLPAVTIPGKGTHNVLFVATEHDSVYAFDADSNTGANATPLWQITLLDAAHGAAAGATTLSSSADYGSTYTDIVPEIGITGTPVIDPATGTLYVVGKQKESGVTIQRLHALDVTTGAEKTSFNSPVRLQASVLGGGGSTVTFSAYWENQRPALLLLNGIVYIGFASHGDSGPWHGWILAYNAATLQQTGAFCTTSHASGSVGSGIWMPFAADVIDPVNHPYGRLFVATGNGPFNAAPPYTNSMDYGDDILRLDLTNGVPTVADAFTPFNQQSLANSDLDTGSGGVLLLPDQTFGSPHLLVQAGKEGRIFLVDRDNMGGYSTSRDAIVQEIPAAPALTGFQINGIWGAPAYWNGNVYFWGDGDHLKAFSFTNGLLSTKPIGQSPEISTSLAPTVSANGNTNGVVWAIDHTAPALMAYDALDVTRLLYSSNDNASRDALGAAVKFTVATIINGKVYVGAQYHVSVFGPIVTVATPTFSLPGGTYSGPQSVALNDTTGGAAIYYTIDGTLPPASASSTRYTGGSISVSTTTTIKAVATASGSANSLVATATYAIQVAGTSPPPIALAQSASLDAGVTSAASLAFTTNNTAGNLIVVAVRIGSPSTTTVSVRDTNGNSYSLARSQVQTTDGHQAWVYYAKIIAAGANTVTVTLSATATLRVAIHEYSGLDTAAPLDQTTSAPGSGTAPTSGSVTTTAANELLFGMGSSANARTWTAGTGYTLRQAPAGKLETADRIVAATGSFSASASLSAADDWTAIIVTFKTWATGSSPSPAAQPTFSPPGGTYSGSQSVRINDTTSGAAIYYTTDGSTPPASPSSTPYTGPIAVSTTTTIKAVATASGFANSPMATATYTIQAAPPPSPIAFVQSASVDAGVAVATSLAFTTNTTAGNLIVVAIRVGPPTTTTVAVKDSNGNSYTLARSQVQTTDRHQTWVYYANNIAAGPTTVTVTLSTTATLRVAIHEYSGLNTVAPLDQTTSAQGNGTAPTSGSVTTTAASELLFGMGSSANAQSWTAGTGYALRQAPAGKLETADQIVAATGSVSASASLGASDDWTAIIVTFK